MAQLEFYESLQIQRNKSETNSTHVHFVASCRVSSPFWRHCFSVKYLINQMGIGGLETVRTSGRKKERHSDLISFVLLTRQSVLPQFSLVVL